MVLVGLYFFEELNRSGLLNLRACNNNILETTTLKLDEARDTRISIYLYLVMYLQVMYMYVHLSRRLVLNSIIVTYIVEVRICFYFLFIYFIFFYDRTVVVVTTLHLSTPSHSGP